MSPKTSTALRLACGLALVALLSALGVWQLDRARQKRELHARFLDRYEQPALDLSLHAAIPPAAEAWRAAHARGQYTGPTLLLDNRVRHGRPGYEILTGFTLDDGSRLLVDRGWVPAGETRDALPTLDVPAAPTSVNGRLAPAPSTGIDLGGAADPEPVGAGAWRVQRLDFQRLASLSPPGFLPVLLYLDATEPDGYDRAWQLPAPDDGKHTAYAVQWFAMAGAVATLCFIYLRRRPTAPDETT